jgi:hypothetical protein
MSIVRIIGGNSPELFQDMQQMNPFASAVRQEFLDVCQEIHKYLNQ